jgi:hypothetical protein
MSGSVVSDVTLGILQTPVNVEMEELSPTMSTLEIVLTHDYVMLNPPGLPARPPAGGAAILIEVGTFAAGGTISVFDFEGNAIIAAGGGAIAVPEP